MGGVFTQPGPGTDFDNAKHLSSQTLTGSIEAAMVQKLGAIRFRWVKCGGASSSA
jgi:hypothetical protein